MQQKDFLEYHYFSLNKPDDKFNYEFFVFFQHQMAKP